MIDSVLEVPHFASLTLTLTLTPFCLPGRTHCLGPVPAPTVHHRPHHVDQGRFPGPKDVEAKDTVPLEIILGLLVVML